MNIAWSSIVLQRSLDQTTGGIAISMRYASNMWYTFIPTFLINILTLASELYICTFNIHSIWQISLSIVLICMTCTNTVITFLMLIKLYERQKYFLLTANEYNPYIYFNIYNIVSTIMVWYLWSMCTEYKDSTYNPNKSYVSKGVMIGMASGISIFITSIITLFIKWKNIL